ncbi:MULTISPECIES: metal-dependent transcriptional regulator [Thermodesulfovibrio]|uniref:Transcriptional regulator MntR n=2 Tax=Thermodesulfovibrio yellowstonii TaxID=28262 RepID=B5YKN5_THEYD|nr:MULTISPECIES: metal-dependent transcriptional regulator [Thermodesulfovibrio]ACI21194.1 manganese-dependent transcription regulator [Thermodesulfovibrio yellowstonii DSM 11347]MDI6864261.1 metal-dependent transcriptional regulator [Thermodesulfovibrio yellowstonii]GLI53520.1 manganese-dependent transcription regulator [Thermodesulfovibrio islandicus]
MTDEIKLELTENLEDYLYDIFEILKTAPIVRIKDIAKRRNVKLSSVVVAAKSLADKGLINYQKYGYITLTEKGLETAKNIEVKKNILYKFLTEILRVSHESAQKDVHKMEHDLSEETIKKVIEFTQSFGKSA